MPNGADVEFFVVGGRYPWDAAFVWSMREELGPRGSLRCLERLRQRLRPDAPHLQRLSVLVPLAFLRHRAGRCAAARALWEELLPDRRRQFDPRAAETTATSEECTRHVQTLLNLEVADYWEAGAWRGMARRAGPVLDALAELGPTEEPKLEEFIAARARRAGPARRERPARPTQGELVHRWLAPGESDVLEPLAFLDLLQSYAAARRTAPAEHAQIFSPVFATLCRRLVVLGWVAGPRGAYVAACLSSIAIHLSRRGLAKLSWPACRQGLELRRENLGERHPLYGISSANMAATLIDLGRLRAAEPLLQEALAISPEFHHPWYWLARLYAARNRPGDRRLEIRAWQRYLGLYSIFPHRIEEARQRLKGVTLLSRKPRARAD